MDVIYHCAGKVEAGGRWLDFLEVNVLGTERLIQASLEHGVRRFIHVSSIGVYPERPDGAVISEDDGYDDNTGRGGYTRSKIMADQLAFWYARAQSAPITVIRPATIYGPGGKNNLVRVGVKKGRFNVIFGDGGSIMPLVYVDNVVDALVLAARRDEAIGRAYNVVDDDRITQREYLERMGAALGRPQSTTYLPLAAPFGFWPAAPTRRRRRFGAGSEARRACSRGSAAACRARSTTRRAPRPSWDGSRGSTSRRRCAASERKRADEDLPRRTPRVSGGMALVLVGSSGVPAAAQVPPRASHRHGERQPRSRPSGGKVAYAIIVKNDGTTKAKNVVVTIPMPADTAFDKCTVVKVEGGRLDALHAGTRATAS